MNEFVLSMPAAPLLMENVGEPEVAEVNDRMNAP
jgi:hypothetical protein